MAVSQQARRLGEEETWVKQRLACSYALVVLVADQALVSRVLILLLLVMQRELDVLAVGRNYLSVGLFCLLGMAQAVLWVSLPLQLPLGQVLGRFVSDPRTEVRPIRPCLV